MPVRYSQYEGENDPIAFPLTLNDLPFDLTGITHLVLVKSGWDGKLAATLHSGSVLAVSDDLEGMVTWSPQTGDLKALESPYRVYFRAYTSGQVRYLTAPRGDYFEITVERNLL